MCDGLYVAKTRIARQNGIVLVMHFLPTFSRAKVVGALVVEQMALQRLWIHTCSPGDAHDYVRVYLNIYVYISNNADQCRLQSDHRLT